MSPNANSKSANAKMSQTFQAGKKSPIANTKDPNQIMKKSYLKMERRNTRFKATIN